MKEIYIINEKSNASIYGIGSFIREYIICLRQVGVKINLIELNSDEKEFRIEENNELRKIIFPHSSTHNLKKYYTNISRILRAYIEDANNVIFHLHYSISKILIEEVKTFFPLSKVIFTIHYQNWLWAVDGNIEQLNRIISARQLYKKLREKDLNILKAYEEDLAIYTKADSIICLSEDTFDIVKNMYSISESKLYLLPNGLSDTGKKVSNNKRIQFKERFYLEENDKLLLYVGRLDKMKGIFALLSAFKDILKTKPNTKLIIVGAAGDFTPALNISNIISSKITFTGQISQKELAKWYQIADIGIIPSYSEQCSYVGIEMMMYGLPIVASDGYGIRNMFQDYENAIIAKIGNRSTEKEYKNNLSEAILKLLSSDDLCGKLSRKARKMYLEKYSLKIMVKNYRKLFDNL